MKTHSLILFLVAAVCALVSGCASVPGNQVCVSSASIFNHDDLRVWRLTIETQKPEKFRLTGAHFELWGETAPPEAGNRKRCMASMWLVGSQIVYAEHNYIKMIAQACGGTLTYTHELSKDSTLRNAVDITLTNAPVIHPLDLRLAIGTAFDQNLWLAVGPAVYERRAEPSGPANGSQPIRSETNSTSGAAGSRR